MTRMSLASVDGTLPRESKGVTREGATQRRRVGAYRIVYPVGGGVRVVLAIDLGHRRDVYRER